VEVSLHTLPPYAYQPKSRGNGVGCLALGHPPGYLLTNLNRKPWPTDFDALGFRSGHSGLRSVADFLRLNLCQRREQGKEDIADEFTVVARCGFNAPTWPCPAASRGRL
jgi:hypothetical protein